MSDILTAMREFRALDDKRRSGGLGGEEEQRWNALRSLLKGDGKPYSGGAPATARPQERGPSPAPAAPVAQVGAEASAAPLPTAYLAPEPAELAVPQGEVQAAPDFEPAAAAPAEPAPDARVDAAAPAAPPDAMAAAAPDAEGYVWHEASGLYWNVYAQHWYEPASVAYFDVQGASIEPARARQALAEALASIASGGEATASVALPDDIPIDDASFADLFEPTPETLRLTDAELDDEPPAPGQPAPAEPAAAERASADAPDLADDAGEEFVIERMDDAEPLVLDDDGAAAEAPIDVAVELDGDPGQVPDLASGAELLHMAAEAAALPLPDDAAAPAPVAFLAPAADDPWAGVAPQDEADPGAGRWDLVVGPVTPGPARPSFDLWASVAKAPATPAPGEEPRQLAPELLPFDVSRVPVIGGDVAEAEIEAGFAGWDEQHEEPGTEGSTGFALPWEPTETGGSPARARVAEEAPADVALAGEPDEEPILLADEATPGPTSPAGGNATEPLEALDLEIEGDWVDEAPPEAFAAAPAADGPAAAAPHVEASAEPLPVPATAQGSVGGGALAVEGPSPAAAAFAVEELATSDAAFAVEELATSDTAFAVEELATSDAELLFEEPAEDFTAPPAPFAAHAIDAGDAVAAPAFAAEEPAADAAELLVEEPLEAEVSQAPAATPAFAAEEPAADAAELLVEEPAADAAELLVEEPAADAAELLVEEPLEALPYTADPHAWLAEPDDDALGVAAGPSVDASGRVIPAPSEAAPVAAAMAPPPAPAAAPAPLGRMRIERTTPQSSPTAVVGGRVYGEHRVVIHTRDGVVKRGTIDNVDLAARTFPLANAEGAREEVATSSLKAVFLMRPADAPPPEPQGRGVKLTLIDGRPLAGWADDSGDPAGFFLVPADTRGNASRVFVYRAAIRSIAGS